MMPESPPESPDEKEILLAFRTTYFPSLSEELPTLEKRRNSHAGALSNTLRNTMPKPVLSYSLLAPNGSPIRSRNVVARFRVTFLPELRNHK